MQKYRLLNNELMAMQWTRQNHSQVARWLQDHGFGYHVHDEEGEIWPDDWDITAAAMSSMCVDTVDDLEIGLGWWLTWDPATGKLGYDIDGPWELVTE